MQHLHCRQYPQNCHSPHVAIGRLLSAALATVAVLFTSVSTATADSSLADTPPSPPALLLTGSVLQVNNDGLTSAEVLKPLREPLAELARSTNRDTFTNKTLPIIGRATIDHIYNLLIYQQAKKELDKIDNVDKVLESYMTDKRNELLSDYGGSAASAEGELARQGTTLDQELKEIERALIIDSYRQKYFAPSNEVTRSQLLRYYRNHREEFAEKGMIQFQLIEVQMDRFRTETSPEPQPHELAREYAQQQAQQALQALTAGDDFADVARKFSHGFRKSYGGVWTPTDPDALKKKYRPLLVELNRIQVGEHTAIVPGDDCFFIAKLLDRKTEKVIPFSQAQIDIAQKLRQEKWRMYTEKLGADLRTKATIGNLDKFIDETTAAAYNAFR